MKSRSSHGPFALAVLFAWFVTLLAAPAVADDDIELIPEGKAPAAAPAPAPAPQPPAAPAPAPGEIEIRGMHCTPDVKEVEVRRPIPVSCTVDYPVTGVELRYKVGSAKWEKIDLEQAESGYTGTIPCAVTSKTGTLKLYLFARNEKNKVIARVGRNESPLSVRLVQHSKAPPPALPGQAAPQRCFEPNECPPELVGTQACPGTHVSKSAKKGWGASCALTSECSAGLECVKGSCESPAKCEANDDCSEGGECIDGKCHVPDAEELKGQLGPAKHHWFGLHFATDFLIPGEGSAICGPDASSADAKKFACFQGGNEYTGTPNTQVGNHFSGGFYVATMRALLSYDYMVGRFSVGGRLGWAFRGAPKSFSPIHIEARAAYSLRKDPFKLNFRPYLGLAFGHAQVDASSKTDIVDCVSGDATCISTADKNALNGYLMNGEAAIRHVEAYRSGAPFFFGPTIMLMYALTNDAAIIFNVNAMFPDVAIQPSVGYQMAL